MPPLTEQAFGEFYRETARPLWAYVYRATGSAAEADDIVQDAFCRFLGADTSAMGSEDRRRYLFRIAGNAMNDQWRRAARERSWLDRLRGVERPQAPGTSPADDVGSTFAALKPRERALLWLAYVEEHSHEEIAEALGVQRASVKVLLSRARARLRDLLKTKAVF